MQRRKHVSIWLSDDERKLVRSAAAMYDMTMSRFIRSVSLLFAKRVAKNPSTPLPRIEKYIVDDQGRKGN